MKGGRRERFIIFLPGSASSNDISHCNLLVFFHSRALSIFKLVWGWGKWITYEQFGNFYADET